MQISHKFDLQQYMMFCKQIGKMFGIRRSLLIHYGRFRFVGPSYPLQLF